MKITLYYTPSCPVEVNISAKAENEKGTKEETYRLLNHLATIFWDSASENKRLGCLSLQATSVKNASAIHRFLDGRGYYNDIR